MQDEIASSLRSLAMTELNVQDVNLNTLYCKRIVMSNITVISCRFSVFRLRKYKMIQLTNETIYLSANQKNNLPIYQSTNLPIRRHLPISQSSNRLIKIKTKLRNN